VKTYCSTRVSRVFFGVPPKNRSVIKPAMRIPLHSSAFTSVVERVTLSAESAKSRPVGMRVAACQQKNSNYRQGARAERYKQARQRLGLRRPSPAFRLPWFMPESATSVSVSVDSLPPPANPKAP
jgi:hypothetical protein